MQSLTVTARFNYESVLCIKKRAEKQRQQIAIKNGIIRKITSKLVISEHSTNQPNLQTLTPKPRSKNPNLTP